MLFIAACGIVFGFITAGRFTLIYAFNANFLFGPVVTAAGILMLLFPDHAVFKRDKLLDHTTFVERTKETRESRRARAFQLLLTGVLIIIFAGSIQMALWLIV